MKKPQLQKSHATGKQVQYRALVSKQMRIQNSGEKRKITTTKKKVSSQNPPGLDVFIEEGRSAQWQLDPVRVEPDPTNIRAEIFTKKEPLNPIFERKNTNRQVFLCDFLL